MSQDQRVHQPQDAFAELGRLSFADHSVESVMEKIATLAKRTVPGAHEVSVTLVEGGKPTTVAYTGVLAIKMDERQYERGHGPCLDCIDGAQPVRINDMAGEDRWPAWTAEAHRSGVGSSLSIPAPLQREVSAALNIYSTEEQAFSDEAVAVGSTFASYAAVALTNMHLYQTQSRLAEDLQHAMAFRAVIEQAKGILMAMRRCTADQAFDHLVRMSQNGNRKLRDVAQTIVDTGSPEG